MENNQFMVYPIGEGIHSLFIPAEKFKTNITGILLRSRLDKKSATYNALLAQVLKAGCKKYASRLSLARKAEEMYGAIFDISIVKKGGEQIIFFFLETLKEEYVEENLKEEGLRFLNEVLCHPLLEGESFSTTVVEREKEVLRQRIKSRMDDKKEYAKERCFEEMFPDDPFGVYADGYEDELNTITAESLYDHYRRALSENPLEFVFTGKNDAEETNRMVKEIFQIKREKCKRWEREKNRTGREKENYVEEEMDISQGKLAMGFDTGLSSTGKEFYSLLVFNELLGGGASSRLFLNVREKEGLCYYINTYIYRFKMILFLQAGIDRADFKKAVDLIKKTVEEMKRAQWKEEELELAKKSLKKSYSSLQDYQSGLMDFYVTQYCLESGDTIETLLENIDTVTGEDLKKAAESLVLNTVYFLSKNKEA